MFNIILKNSRAGSNLKNFGMNRVEAAENVEVFIINAEVPLNNFIKKHDQDVLKRQNNNAGS